MKSAKVAFSIFNKRIASVFDTASEIIVVEVEDSEVIREEKNSFINESAYERIEFLKSIGVSEIVCGAISKAVQEQIELKKIGVTSFISGNFTEVRDGWVNGELWKEGFIMPGCCGRRRGRGRAVTSKREGSGNGFLRNCDGTGKGRGLGRGAGLGNGRGVGLGNGRGARLGNGPSAGLDASE